LDGWEKTAIALECKAMIVQLDPFDDEAEQAARMATERQATREIADALATQLRLALSTEPESAAAAVQAVDDHVGTVTDALRRALVASTDLGVRIGVQQLENIGLGFDWTLANTAARDWANQYVGELITNIQETTRAQVRQAVAAWVDNGDPLETLIRELEPTFGRARAELIASTEVTKASAEGTTAAYQESGVIDKMQWRTARDELVCPICGALNGVQAALGQPFENPQNGRSYMPPAHPRCRCWIVPVVD
jgi:SPP1 gp7 family putative phage head morphogenesis protein